MCALQELAIRSPVLSPHVKEFKTVLDSGSHSVDCGFRVLDFQWNVDSGFHALSGISKYLSSILDSGYHKQNFRGFWILQARISQIHGAKYQSNIFGPVHAYLIKQWEIYFSSNVRFQNVMDWSNFWSVQLFQTGPHFKLEEVFFPQGFKLSLTLFSF